MKRKVFKLSGENKQEGITAMEKVIQCYEQEIEAILANLTEEEKLTMIHGWSLFDTKAVEEKGIPILKMSDGPMGVRNEFLKDRWVALNHSDDFVSYMPSNSAIASTWNTQCAYNAGKVLGEEARGREKDVILAPGINIKRDPLCGRNFEYMSEDPYVVEEMTVPMIKGIQESDVAACVKHFAANSQETNRFWVDTIIDERTFREIYLPGFKAAVQKAGTYSLMNAYNKLDGVHCSENTRLLDEILREEWGFDGVVISDWSSVRSTEQAAKAGLDIEMRGSDKTESYYFADRLREALEDGRVAMEDVDKKVRNILRLMFRVKMIGKDACSRKAGAYNTREHQELLRDMARESIILLKNEEGLLPITEDRTTPEAAYPAPKRKKIAVIGRNAEYLHANGGGSAEIKALYEISPLMGIKAMLGGNVDVEYAPGYYITEKIRESDLNWQAADLEGRTQAEETEYKLLEEVLAARKQALEEAVALAKEADEVIFVGGLNHDYDVEGKDRTDMKLPYAQDELVEALLKVNSNTIVVLTAGSPVEMPWKDRAKAIVWCYYAGMETGYALAEILFGKISPSGKLAESFPDKYEDTVTGKSGQFGREDKVVYEEGLFFGYRYYEREMQKPAFAFGHGLSYTKFAYDHLKVTVLPGAGKIGCDACLERDAVKISVEVTNVGNMPGAESLQCYVSDTECSVERPKKELRAFGKVFLEPGETKILEMTIRNRGFAYYHTQQKAFVIEEGEFLLHVGTASDNIFQTEKIILTK